MTEDNGPYWVSASLEDDDMEEKIAKAFDEAGFVRMWAVEELTERWQAATGFPTTAQLVPALTKFIHEKGIHLQRYTALSILNSTVTRFNRHVVTERTGGELGIALVTLPKISMAEPIELIFQARAVWRRYVFSYGQISTVYGIVYLSGEWSRVLHRQAKEIGVNDQLFPYLWYSAGLVKTDEKYKLRFHAHLPTSAMGKQLDKKRKEREKWQ